MWIATEAISWQLLETILPTVPESDREAAAILFGGGTPSAIYYTLGITEHISGVGVVSDDASQALFQIAILDQHPAPHPPRIHFAGLNPAKRYHLRCIWPEFLTTEASTFAGSALMQYGMQLPQTTRRVPSPSRPTSATL